MFDRLAAVEAALHGVSVADVSFHEVGALDSILDIVGVAAALVDLSPRRSVSRVVPVGSGQVRTAHGLLPVPAPATLALLQGIPIEAGGPPVELTTPTGALILATQASAFGALPAMRPIAVGHGAGTRDLPDRPNLLRIIAGHEDPPASSVQPTDCVVLEVNLDDMSPQLVGPLPDRLLAAGARDVWLVPVQMKKGRPGVLLSVLCDVSQQAVLQGILFAETTTLGIRSHVVQREVLLREHVTVHTAHGPIRIKLGRDPHTGQIHNAAPEFVDCQAAAAVHRVPLKQVHLAALLAYQHSQRPAP
jgi:uncharacterized protein (TIGR00299 family) protein